MAAEECVTLMVSAGLYICPAAPGSLIQPTDRMRPNCVALTSYHSLLDCLHTEPYFTACSVHLSKPLRLLQHLWFHIPLRCAARAAFCWLGSRPGVQKPWYSCQLYSYTPRYL